MRPFTVKGKTGIIFLALICVFMAYTSMGVYSNESGGVGKIRFFHEFSVG